MSDRSPATPPHAAPWACPFCALLCDDRPAPALGADAAGSVAAPGCERARRLLAAAVAARGALALRNGQPCSVDEALDAAAAAWQAARAPFVGGLAADVHGLRAVLRLAEASHAVVDHGHGAGLAAVLTAMQDRGSFTTTLAEVRTRADLVLLVGRFDAAAMPRLAERLALAEPLDDGRARQVLAFGGTGVSGVAREPVLPQADLYEAVPGLCAAVAGHPAPTAAAAPLRALAERLRAARYVAVVWAPGQLPGPQPALLVEALHRLVKLLNRSTRAGALMLAGPDGALTAQQVMTWRAGLPLRSAFHPAGLQHEPHRFGLDALLGRGAVDALLWVSCFDPALGPPAAAATVPTVLIGHPGLAATEAARRAAAYIACAVPGVHAGGHLTRTDVVVTVPLAPLQPSALPSAESVIGALQARLAQRAGVAA